MSFVTPDADGPRDAVEQPSPVTGIRVSNLDFLKGLFGVTHERAWVTARSYADDSSGSSGWGGGLYDLRRGWIDNHPELDAYVCVSIFRPDDGGCINRDAAHFEAQLVLMVDDLGTKVPMSLLDRLPPCTALVETSPGNHQAWWRLAEAVSNAAQLHIVMNALTALSTDGKDPGHAGVTRYGRLPVGRNSKPVYNGGNGVPVRLMQWHHENDVLLTDFAQALGIADLAAAASAAPVFEASKALPAAADVAREHPVIQAYAAHGLLLRAAPDTNGWWPVICLWKDEHTVKDDRTGIYIREDGGWGHKCQHGHCDGRHVAQVRAEFLRSFGVLLPSGSAPIPEGIGNSAGPHDDPQSWGGAVPAAGIARHDPNATDAPKAKGRAPLPASVHLTDFYAYMPAHSFLYVPSREMWPAASINGRLPATPIEQDKYMSPSRWLDTHRPIEQVTWSPGEPELIEGRLVQVSGWVDRPGVKVFNLYRPPPCIAGDASQAGRWLDHIHSIYPDDADHLIRWLAQRLQRPGVKINHAIVLGGKPGIGKDSLLVPIRAGVGPWNVQDVKPPEVMGAFNSFAKCVLLVVSEARDQGEFDRFAFHDHMKVYLAAPPEVLRVNEKHLREHYVANCMGVVFTTNHATDALFLPADDRRHYVTWSEADPGDFAPDYWPALHQWFDAGGSGHVVAYLRGVDLSGFDPKAPPRKTPAFWRMVAAGESPESGELRDVLEELGDPAAVTLTMLLRGAQALHKFELHDELNDRKQHRAMPHKLDRVGYVPVRNLDAEDGLFKIDGKRQRVYAPRRLALPAQIAAARKLANAGQSSR